MSLISIDCLNILIRFSKTSKRHEKAVPDILNAIALFRIFGMSMRNSRLMIGLIT